VLLYLLAVASGNTQAFARHYPLLLVVNGVIAALLFVLVATLVARVVRRWRAKRFGARLMARFALAFTLMGVVPGVLLYVVSIQFLSKSIESWFDVRVDRALESALTLGRAALEDQLEDLTRKARTMALELADVSESMQLAALDRARERAGVHEAILVTAGGQLLGASGQPSERLVPALPQTTALRQARLQRVYAVIEGDETSTHPDTGLRTRVIVPVPAVSPFFMEPGIQGQQASSGFVSPSGERYLQLVQRLPPSVLAHAAALSSGYRDYQDLSLSRNGLRKIYTVTLTLTLLLAVFAATASGVLLASSMTAPLLQVAAGTKAVAEGDFRPVREFKGNDELNLLTQSFNAMTRQLTEARDAVEARSRELENARAFLERVLTNLSAGVLVLDQQYRFVTANHGASRILGLPLGARLNQPFTQVHPEFAQRLEEGFADHAWVAAAKDSWQKQIELARTSAASGSGDGLILLVRGSGLPLEDGPGYVVVFDDITQILSAQRALAWGEVARRLAHEIKNPLTPIQLAAERLQMKLSSKLPEDAVAVLARGTATIVNQVTAMKRMVEDFRQYARLPAAQFGAVDLNALVAEVAGLYGASEQRVGQPSNERHTPVALRLETDLPFIWADAGQIRQVLHNLIGNAQEAVAGAQMAGPEGARPHPWVTVRTESIELPEAAAEWTEAGGEGQGARHAVRLSVEDEGPGFPANILRRAFEPYVTTKPSGTGLGLAMAKKMIDEHDARIELVNRVPYGASVTIVFRRLASFESSLSDGDAEFRHNRPLSLPVA